MSLRDELRKQLQAFAEGRTDERALFTWLGGAGRFIDREDPETRRTWESASALLAEVAGWPHDVQDVRTDIAHLLASATAPTVHVWSANGVSGEVREQLKAFVEGRLDAHEFAGWLDSIAPELHEAGEENLRSLVGQVYVLLAELGYGDRTAESTRHEVATLICQAQAPDFDSNGSSGTIIPASLPPSSR